MTEAVTQRIEALLASSPVVLFMKGTRSAPQCGFSATVVSILDQYLPDYLTVNVLSDPEVREGIKTYANWPTIPQLYIRSEFVGGCDIIRQMDEEGELVAALGDAVEAPSAPNIEVSERAASVFREALAEGTGSECLRITIDPHFQHDLSLDTPRGNDVRLTVQGLDFILDFASARRAEGLAIDYITEPEPGFKIKNPSSPPQVEQISAKEAQVLVAETPGARFIDVRTPKERETAHIEGTTLLAPESAEALASLPKDTPLVFHCHHGQRSYAAALQFLEQGFTRVFNVVGGIEAWSLEVDPSVPRY